MSLVKFYNLTTGSYDSQWDDGILLDSPNYAYIFGTQFSSKAKVDSDIEAAKTELNSTISSLQSTVESIDTTNLEKLDEMLTRNITDTLNSLENVPTNKAYLVANITSNQTLSFANTWTNNTSVHIFIQNSGTSEVTITIPNTGVYVNMSAETLVIPASYGGEIDAFYDGYNVWLRHAPSELAIDANTDLDDGDHQLG